MFLQVFKGRLVSPMLLQGFNGALGFPMFSPGFHGVLVFRLLWQTLDGMSGLSNALMQAGWGITAPEHWGWDSPPTP